MAEEINPSRGQDIHKPLGGTANTAIFIWYLLFCDRNLNLRELLPEGPIPIAVLVGPVKNWILRKRAEWTIQGFDRGPTNLLSSDAH
jgi:hypothetical protein